ncbi:hypothetical protein L198_01671 [Cryptococcus wingfieldii CBS 7118]|uniref:Gfd2/YDR514C-like C-terminal domain-containing protein n=1 Tax=Cryptococcus wingfieldii CBS 7118 TaxID=1295528 RepID=A0A1E3K050_9TREE|nr:hypothetical protein L198_01671 [Cryptococcus wingfieldii CBS 7118]ODO06439.1 hypothetical protein L198_01671 [Cryptococcus wingfieldii CBS 7118]
MADATKYGNAADFDVELHSIYAAYIGLFESSNVDWWDKSWGGYFVSFNDFLGFGWEVMGMFSLLLLIVDGVTGKPHIAVRREQIALFARMIRTRQVHSQIIFGENLPKDPPTTLPLTPVPTRNLALRRLVNIRDLSAYRKLAATLPAAELSYLRSRVRSGEPAVIEQLFYAGGSSGERDTGGVGVRDNGVGYTFACVKTNWWEKGGAPYGVVPGQGKTQPGKGPQGKGLVLEVGMAVLRCANLRAVGVWPPTPEDNYRKSHYVVDEWRTNHSPPTFPRAYAFGRSEYVAEKKIETILDATLNALASQETDGHANTLILLTIGDGTPLPLPNSSTLPANILVFDLLALEFNLLRRAQAQGIPGAPDRHQPLSSLVSLLQTLQIPVTPYAPLGNAGNDAYYTLLAFQKLVMGETRLPDMLFKQPGPYSAMPFPAGAGNRMSMAMPFAPVMNMPLPVMPAAGHVRRESNSSRASLRTPASEYGSYPPSPAEEQKRRRMTSDVAKRRPSSTGDALGAYSFNNRSQSQQRSLGGSSQNLAALGSGRNRQSMVRSQTVFWDDAQYAPPSADNQGSSLKAPQAPLHGESTGASSNSSENRGRPKDGPPVSRSAGSSVRLAAGRGVSFDGTGGDTNAPGRGSAGNSPVNGTMRPPSYVAGNGSAASVKPSGLSSTNLKKHDAGRTDSSGTISTGITKPSSNSNSSGDMVIMPTKVRHSTGAGQVVNDEKANATADVKGDKEKKPKKSKNIAGAFAKFWVG